MEVWGRMMWHDLQPGVELCRVGWSASFISLIHAVS